MDLRYALRRFLEHLQHKKLRSFKTQVAVHPSVRLFRKFSVRFYVVPDERRYLTVGEHCLLNASVTFESKRGTVKIGDRCYMGVGTSIISRNSVTIGDDVTMAWGITIYDHNSHSFDWRLRKRVDEHFYRTYGTSRCFEELEWTDVEDAPIVICDRVWIGFDAVILKGVTVGEGAIIGARSVVTRDVEPYTVVAGNPARVVRRLNPDQQMRSRHV